MEKGLRSHDQCENEYRSIQHGLDNYTHRLVINTADSDSDIDLFESTDSEMEVIENKNYYYFYYNVSL